MFRSGWTFGHFRGIPLRLHVSLLLLPLIAISFPAQNIPYLLDQAGIQGAQIMTLPLVVGFVFSVTLFASVLLHELGHAAVALKVGSRVKSINLMILGGITEIDQDDATPGETLRIAAAGPLVNFILGGIALLILPITAFSGDLHAGVMLFAALNLLLAVFNLFPALPLDGGRILRAAIEMKTNRLRATRIAVGIGRLIAAGACLAGLMTGDLFLVLMAGFLYLGGVSERNSARMRQSLEGLTVRQAMTIQVVSVEPSRPTTSVARHMLMHDARAALVRDSMDTYGVILAEDLTGQGDREVGDLVDGAPLWAHVDDDLSPVVREMRWSRKPVIVRDACNTPVGVVTLGDIFRAASLRQIADEALGGVRASIESSHHEA